MSHKICDCLREVERFWSKKKILEGLRPQRKNFGKENGLHISFPGNICQSRGQKQNYYEPYWVTFMSFIFQFNKWFIMCTVGIRLVLSILPKQSNGYQLSVKGNKKVKVED